MALPTRDGPTRALTASAVKLDISGNTDSAYLRRQRMAWQEWALSIYDEIGELRQAAQFYARMMAKVVFYAGTEDQTTGTITRLEDGPAVDALNRIQDPGGGRTALQYDYGQLMWLTGEGVLFGSNLATPDERWRFLWNDEVRQQGNVWVRLDRFKQPIKPLETGVAYRFWTPHPRHSDEADAPMRAIRMIAEEILLLSSAVRATAVTRMTEGMMVVPLEAVPTMTEPLGDEDPENNVFLQDYIEHTENAIENPGTAQARAPFLFTPPYDYADRVQWMETHNPETDYMEQKLREELLGRAAIAFDMPPEAFKGMADANHWTAKQVMHDMWISHGVPVAQRFATSLADAYLRPALRQTGMSEDDVRKSVVGYDDSQVVISPDRSQQAVEAYQNAIIGASTARQVMGYTEDQAPSDEELKVIIALRSRDPLGSAQEISGQAGERGPLPTPAPSASDQPAAPANGRTGTRQEAMRASLEHGFALAALRRCRELAGSRIVTASQKNCPDCKEKTDGKPTSLVASILGTSQVATLGFNDPVKLVQGGGDGFRDFLVEEGYGKTEAEGLKRVIEVYAAKTLFESKPSLPAGFIAQIERAREVSEAHVAA